MGVRKALMKAEEVNLHMTIYDGDRKSLEAYKALMEEFQRIALKELMIPANLVPKVAEAVEEIRAKEKQKKAPAKKKKDASSKG